jgi:hypothetical protein
MLLTKGFTQQHKDMPKISLSKVVGPPLEEDGV